MSRRASQPNQRPGSLTLNWPRPAIPTAQRAHEMPPAACACETTGHLSTPQDRLEHCVSTSEQAQPAGKSNPTACSGTVWSSPGPPSLLLFPSCSSFLPICPLGGDRSCSLCQCCQDLMDGRGSKHGTLPSLCSVTVTTANLVFPLPRSRIYSLLLPTPPRHLPRYLGSPDAVLLRARSLPTYLVAVLHPQLPGSAPPAFDPPHTQHTNFRLAGPPPQTSPQSTPLLVVC